jgi:hypothetical protein
MMFSFLDFIGRAAGWTGLILAVGVITEVIVWWTLGKENLFGVCAFVLVIIWLIGLAWIGRESISR